MASNSHHLALTAGSSQCAYITNANQEGLGLTGDFIISFWAYFPSGQTTGSPVIINKHLDSAGEKGYSLFYNLDTSPDRFTLNLHEDDSTNCAIYWEFARPTAWHHFELRCDISNGLSTKCELLINNISQGNGTTSGSNVTSINDNSQPFIIGADSIDGTSNPSTMWIDSLKVYNSLVDSDKVFQYSTSGSSQSEVAGFWPFDNNPYDATTNNNTLVEVNSPTYAATTMFSTYGLLTKFTPAFDGYLRMGQDVGNRSSTWTNIHGATSGDALIADMSTGATARSSIEIGQAGAGNWTVHRFFSSFDTSSLTASPVGGFLWTRQSSTDFDVAGELALVNPTPAGNTSLVADDFDQCGSINSPDEGASRFDTDDVVNGVWFKLNSTGLGWVDDTSYTLFGIRIADDFSDSTPSHTGTQRTMINFHTVQATTEEFRPWFGAIMTDASSDSGAGGGAGDPIDTTTSQGSSNVTAPSGAGGSWGSIPSGGGSGPGGASDAGTVALVAGIIIEE